MNCATEAIPDMILLTQYYTIGALLSLQSMIPPNKHLDFPPLMGGCSEGLDAFREHQIKELQVCESSVCMVTHIPRVWINRVRLPILLVVS